MQTECLDIDTLTSVAAALGWRTEAGIEHLSKCVVCRESLADLARVRTALGDAVEPGATFCSDVMSALRLQPAIATRWAPWVGDQAGSRVLLALFVAAGSFVVATAPANGQWAVPSGAALVVALILSLALGIGVAWRAMRATH